MRLIKAFSLLLALILVACQAQATPTAEREPPPTAEAASTPLAGTTVAQPVDFTTRGSSPVAGSELKTYQPAPYAGSLDALPINLETLGNPATIQGLTAEQKAFLSQNGFVVIQAGDLQFNDIRRITSKRFGQPYYLTTDAAYHALHRTFDGLLAGLEEEYMRSVLGRLLEAEYDQVGAYAAATSDPALLKDIKLARDFLAVAIKLIDPEHALDPQMETRIAPQIEQIMAYNGKSASMLIPNFIDDYGAYRPIGHYAGKPALENYFRAMTWLGHVAFKFKDPDEPGLVPSRAPLILTLALREAQVDGHPAYRVWSNLYEITDFMIGPSDDPGPVELNALMEQVYGDTLTLADLSDEAQWQVFLAATEQMPAPQINSTFASSSVTQAASRDWRLMGQRFTLDGFIFQSLIFDKVGTGENPRGFPSGLDVAAAFGSASALQALEAAGETRYANYNEQMATVQQTVNNQPEDQWLNRFYSAWLYAFRPQAQAKDASFPPYMRTGAWGYKEANSLLGSWAELKHDTILYAKLPFGRGGGGPPDSGPAPAYVEPNPNVFYRLAYAADALHKGLLPYFQGTLYADKNVVTSDIGLHRNYWHLEEIAALFQQFGDIAVRELQGQPLTPEDYEVIQTCLELKDCIGKGRNDEDIPKVEPIPVVAAVSGWKDEVLEAAVGEVNRIYVVVPLEGTVEIAQGGVFSYYEFTQPLNDRLTDEAWRERLAKNPPPSPAWVSQFVLPGGGPNITLAFRVGDIYYLTEEGYNPPLNLREDPSTSSAVLRQLDDPNFYFTISEGPVKNAEGSWWKVKLSTAGSSDEITEGWIFENPAWFERSVAE